MPIATRAELEAIRGPAYIADLLSVARQFGEAVPVQEAQEQARLDQALQAGDDLISQFLPLPTDTVPTSLRRFAVNEAIYYLQQNSQAGTTEAQDAAAQMRRTDLAKMRERGQWPGSAEGQRSVASGVVKSASRYSLKRMVGLI